MEENSKGLKVEGKLFALNTDRGALIYEEPTVVVPFNALSDAKLILTDGDVIPVENLGPWDDMDEAIRAIEAHETAVDILVAQRRTEIGAWRINAVIRELDPVGDDYDFGYGFIDGPEDDDHQSGGADAG